MTKIMIDVPAYPNIKDQPRIVEEHKLMKLIQKHVSSESIIIDFGCGTSYYTEGYAIGIDLDRKLLRKAKVKHKILCDYHYAPFRNNVADAIVMCHSLEHTNMPSIPLKQAHRILKVGGVIGVSVPNAFGFRALYLLFFKQKLMTVAPDHLTSFTPKTLEALLRRCGFHVSARAGDILYIPFMERLGLMKLGYWLAGVFSHLSNVYVVLGKKQ